MRVFKTCIKILRKRWISIFIYIFVFLVMSLLFTMQSQENLSAGFSETKPTFTLINRDTENSELLLGFESYLSEHAEKLDLEDSKEKIQDAIFYHETDCIFFIPSGFSESLKTSSPMQLETILVPNSINGYRCETLAEQYFNTLSSYLMTASFDSRQAVSAALKDLSISAKTEITTFTESSPVDPGFEAYLRFFSYISLIVMIFIVSIVTMVFHRRDIHLRNTCAPLKPRSISFQTTLAVLCAGLVMWIIMLLQGIAVYSSKIADTDPKVLTLLTINTFVFMIVSLSVAMLASSFVKNDQVQSAVGNVISLGMSFLGGAFVPLEMLSPTMVKIAMFTPTYWYMDTITNIKRVADFSFDDLMPVINSSLMQLGFAVAIFSVYLVLNKVKSRSDTAYQNNPTELEQ